MYFDIDIEPNRARLEEPLQQQQTSRPFIEEAADRAHRLTEAPCSQHELECTMVGIPAGLSDSLKNVQLHQPASAVRDRCMLDVHLQAIEGVFGLALVDV